MRHLAASFLVGALAAILPASATDVAFWEEYAPHGSDANTYLLMQFNGQALVETEGKVKSVEVIGGPASEANGDFGRAAALDGKNELLIVLASWFGPDVDATVKLGAPLAGTASGNRNAINAESSIVLARTVRDQFTVRLPGPWGVMMVKLCPARA